MTSIFNDDGRQIAATVLEVGPCFVTALRTPEKNGYSAVQLGWRAVPDRKLSKAALGHLKKSSAPALRHLKEFRTESLEGLEVGQQVKVDNFEPGDFLDVQGVSVGRGFQGVVKRHRFKGAQTMSHGTKMGREPGSVGSKAGGAGCRKKTMKGKRMPGHMGSEVVTIQNLKVLKVDAENNLLVVSGAVPGAEDQCLVIRASLKKGTARNWKIAGDKVKASETSAEAAPSKSKPEDSEEKS